MRQGFEIIASILMEIIAGILVLLCCVSPLHASVEVEDDGANDRKPHNTTHHSASDSARVIRARRGFCIWRRSAGIIRARSPHRVEMRRLEELP